MIVNPGKFQAIIFDKHKGNHTSQIINVDQKEIKAVSKVELSRIEIDDKLNFNHVFMETDKIVRFIKL